MGNWDNTFYEIFEEVSNKNLGERFEQLVLNIQRTEEFKRLTARDHWLKALEIVNDEN